MSIAVVKTVAFNGIETIKIDVEVHIGNGLPYFTIVGLPDKSIAEAKERIRAVFNVIGLSLPPKRITVNMSPASLQKEGSHYDLPIAVGILVAMNVISQDAVTDWLIMGELSLNGQLQAAPGVLMAAIFANENNYTLICPFASGSEAKLAGGKLHIIAPKHFQELIAHLKGGHAISENFECTIEKDDHEIDFSDVHHQEIAKRALEIAAAGRLHVLLIGPPGVGKSMLAKRMATILPSMSAKESIEVTMIYSIVNKLNKGMLKTKRPYRDPHHSASLVALVGGGAKALPGEISLAHNGILFLDELAEYSKALEGLRQSMESGFVTIARAQNHITYPANAQIIAAMNPCKCGYSGTSQGCMRGPSCAQEYQKRISGPILDRFDMIIHMENVNMNAEWGVELVKANKAITNNKSANNQVISKELRGNEVIRNDFTKNETTNEYESTHSQLQSEEIGNHLDSEQANIKQNTENNLNERKIETSAQIKKRVIEAREFELSNFNSNLQNLKIEELNIESDAMKILIKFAQTKQMSRRVFVKIAKIARTIANLEKNLNVTKEHILEAIMYRKI